MDKPTPKERLIHILEALEAIRAFMRDVNEEDFLADIKLQCAVQYQFLIVGEAIGQIDAVLLRNMIIRGIFPNRSAILSFMLIML